MNDVEAKIVACLTLKQVRGEHAVSEADLMKEIVSADQPKLRYRPRYRYALDRLLTRSEINACDAPDGVRYYFIGPHATQGLVEWLKSMGSA